MNQKIVVPEEVVNFCKFEALGQVLSEWDDQLLPDQIVDDLRDLGDEIPSDENLPEVIVYGGFDGFTGEQLADQFDDFFEAFLSVAKLAIVRTQMEVKNV